MHCGTYPSGLENNEDSEPHRSDISSGQSSCCRSWSDPAAEKARLIKPTVNLQQQPRATRFERYGKWECPAAERDCTLCVHNLGPHRLHSGHSFLLESQTEITGASLKRKTYKSIVLSKNVVEGMSNSKINAL